MEDLDVKSKQTEKQPPYVGIVVGVRKRAENLDGFYLT